MRRDRTPLNSKLTKVATEYLQHHTDNPTARELLDELEKLLKAGANPNISVRATTATDDDQPKLPLLIAAITNNAYSLARLLIRFSAKVNIACTENEETSLHYACQQYKEKDALALARLLLVNGADVNKTSYNGVSPLMLAAGNGYVRLMDLFLEAGAETNMISNDGSTLLHYAVVNPRRSSAIIVKHLLAMGVAVNIEDNHGHTALYDVCVRYLAAKTNKENLEDTAVLLIEAGANLRAAMKDDYTVELPRRLRGDEPVPRTILEVAIRAGMERVLDVVRIRAPELVVDHFMNTGQEMSL